MHESCMATKTITLEIDAYEKLKAAKRGGESFSSVVRRAVIPGASRSGAGDQPPENPWDGEES